MKSSETTNFKGKAKAKDLTSEAMTKAKDWTSEAKTKKHDIRGQGHDELSLRPRP